jgi:hypothetical protein
MLILFLPNVHQPRPKLHSARHSYTRARTLPLPLPLLLLLLLLLRFSLYLK